MCREREGQFINNPQVPTWESGGKGRELWAKIAHTTEQGGVWEWTKQENFMWTSDVWGVEEPLMVTTKQKERDQD